MSLPKHKSPSLNRDAKAPYNFVPLPEKIIPVEPASLPDHDRYRPDRYTGSIEVKLTTESPLYIRCGESPAEFSKENKKQSPEFFTDPVSGRPVIPGSSLRGMLRAMVEIVSYGKVQPVIDKPLIYRAVGDRSSLGEYYREQLLGISKTGRPHTHLDYPSKQVKGGYLKRRGTEWVIQPAREYHGESFVHVEYADADKITRGQGKHRVYNVYVVPVSRRTSNRGRRGPGDLILDVAVTPSIAPKQESNNMVPAKLIESGHMGSRDHPKHWHCAIYEPNPNAPWISIPEDIWEAYVQDRDLTRGSGVKTRELKNDGDPLFYLLDKSNKLVFFGPTMMFRLPYPNTPQSLIPNNLYRETDVDLAEAVFGYTKSNKIDAGKARAYAGRVFFNDARLEVAPNDLWLTDEPLTPKILGGPKPTTFQHYLTQQEPNDPKRLDHYAASSPHPTTIRGHKLYWNKPVAWKDSQQARDFIEDKEFLTKPAAERERDTQHTQIKPLKPGVVFNFTIRFENLSLVELGALLWPLHLGAQQEYRLKIGMGKPLGMGSVKSEATLHLTDRQQRYAALFDGNTWQLGVQKNQEDVAVEARQAFEQFILTNDADAFGGEGRLTQLKALLSWPGPAVEKTRYMTIQPNEFKERKVLPTPGHVLHGPAIGGPPSQAGPPAPGSGRPPVSGQGRGGSGQPSQRPAKPHPDRPGPANLLGQKPAGGAPPNQARVQVAVTPPAFQAPSPGAGTPKTGIDLPEVGATFTGPVESIRPDGTVIVQYKNRATKEVRGVIAPANLVGKQFTKGSLARCEVINTYQEAGMWILECKPGSKKEKGK